jgi:hypothetical protein
MGGEDGRPSVSRRAYFAYLELKAAWLAAAAFLYPIPYGWFVAGAVIWWGLITMVVATGYYIIQEAPAARVTGWLRRDLLVNVVLALALLAAMLEGLGGYRRLSLQGVGWVAFAAAVIHPLAVDLPHRRHHQADPAGSPVPQYVPPACLWIDATIALLVLVALLVLL